MKLPRLTPSRRWNGKGGILIIVVTFWSGVCTSQSSNSSIDGEYFMQGVMDMASVLWLKPDSTFEYFFSYGAVDRTGKGRWKLLGNKVVLNSAPRPEKDFAPVAQSTKSHPGTVIKILHENKMILPFVVIKAHTEKGVVEGKADQEGYFQVKGKSVDSIELMLELCPDRFSVFKVGKANHYEFRIEPWIAEIFFKDFSLELQSNILTGPHPLAEGSTYRYVKGNN